MTALVQRGIEQGDLDPEIDPELAAAVLRGITATLGDLILQRLGLTLQQAAADVERMAGPEIERIFDGLLRILRQGLQRRQ
jgi:hypothetical protein